VPERRWGPGSTATLRRRRPPVAALAGLVIGAAVVLRLALLGRQSYWVDELFSVNQTSGSWSNLLTVGSTELHTPLYAGLLWVWTRIGGPHETWSRLLSVLFAAASVAVAHRGLRPVALCHDVRWAVTTATAASATSLVYSLETRSYALLLLGAVGLTAATVVAAVQTLDGAGVPRRSVWAWLGWGALAATAHPFGTVLVLGAATVLGLVCVGWARPGRPGAAAGWLVLAGVGCSVQAGWVLVGRHRPGFGGDTGWIPAPGGKDVWDLLTTTFGAGGMVAHKGGFAWSSPVGVVVAAILVLVCSAAGHAARRLPQPDAGRPVGSGAHPAAAPTSEAPAAAVLLGLAVVVAGIGFVGAQWTHVWTLRNLAVVSPALLWGVVCLAAALTGTEAGRRSVGVVAVSLLGAALVPTAFGLAAAYKSDFRGLVDYLASAQRQDPAVSVLVLGADPIDGWWAAGGRPAGDPARRTLDSVTVRPVGLDGVTRVAGPQIVVVYHGIDDPRPDAFTARVLDRLGDASCRAVPVYGFGVVRCG
jgi:hypothetical protein